MARQVLILLMVLLVFGVLFPWKKGFDFLDPQMIVAYSCIPLIFVSPASATYFGNSLGASRKTLISHLLSLALYAWAVGALLIATGLAVVSFTNWHGHFLLPPVSLLAAAETFSLAATLAVCAITALLARNFSARTAKTLIRLSFLVALVLVAYALRNSWFSTELTTEGISNFAWRTAAGAAVVGVLCSVMAFRPRAA